MNDGILNVTDSQESLYIIYAPQEWKHTTATFLTIKLYPFLHTAWITVLHPFCFIYTRHLSKSRYLYFDFFFFLSHIKASRPVQWSEQIYHVSYELILKSCVFFPPLSQKTRIYFDFICITRIFCRIFNGCLILGGEKGGFPPMHRCFRSSLSLVVFIQLAFHDLTEPNLSRTKQVSR